MEASSPLAAMQPPAPMPAWGNGPDMFRSHPHPHYSNAGNGMAGRALRERLQKTDYFNIKDLQGSSPAASLAADLSQNFRIDTEIRFVCYADFNRKMLIVVAVLSCLLLGVPSSQPT